ncbi:MULTISPECIES: DUF6480 family protein [unclassified Mycobacterium]|uniref:DUF6480 family protein n=1 Tax=unclassified Mycobacterium TaxID=2642494 RepID=UPI000801B8F5|nr:MULTISPECIES: DUF6480 family protein [unclassified Mycobacterium]OBH00621.1 hypothetical protein A5696_15455 [Mycobacterium sp. E2699]OBI55551.1 hypothetical protein A5705_23665 [Mycobacterium sp. E787]
MTAQPPDPDPTHTPGLEPGGGVAPGTTPPAAPQTSGVAEPQPPRRMPPSGVLTIIGVCVFAVVFIAVAVLLVMKIVGVH